MADRWGRQSSGDAPRQKEDFMESRRRSLGGEARSAPPHQQPAYLAPVASSAQKAVSPQRWFDAPRESRRLAEEAAGASGIAGRAGVLAMTCFAAYRVVAAGGDDDDGGGGGGAATTTPYASLAVAYIDDFEAVDIASIDLSFVLSNAPTAAPTDVLAFMDDEFVFWFDFDDGSMTGYDQPTLDGSPNGYAISTAARR
ncbi:hypothetical protein JL721_5062 [Aureococcus anophagefferens]|nr:hypothetical protein JL721_5062 [Aureococcus anophagefferens]